jgi:hypothetical protein
MVVVLSHHAKKNKINLVWFRGLGSFFWVDGLDLDVLKVLIRCFWIKMT